MGSKDFNLMAGRSLFTNFLLSHRHWGEDSNKPGQNGTWVILTAQAIRNSYSPTIRDQCKLWFLYPPRRPTEMKALEEMAQDPTQMQRAMQRVRNSKEHRFMFLNKSDPEKDQYFLGFKEPMNELS